MHHVMSAHSLTSMVWKWVVQDERAQPNCSPHQQHLYGILGAAPCAQSRWSHEPGFSVQLISQPFWSTPCLLRTTNPVGTQHPGSSEQILEVIFAVSDFF